MRIESFAIDSIHDGSAILQDEGGVSRFTISSSILPSQAKEGDWVKATIDSGRVVTVVMDPEAKKRMASRIQSKLDQLRKR